MLAELSPRQFDEWCAFMAVERGATSQDRDRQDWYRVAKLTGELVNTIIAVSAAVGGQKQSTQHMIRFEDILPDEYRDELQGVIPKSKKNTQDSLTMFLQQVGLPNANNR